MSKPKIALLCAYLSGNMLGRAHVLYELLKEDFDVFITGPDYGLGIWPPVAELELPIRCVDAAEHTFPSTVVRKLVQSAEADLLIASKPLVTSFGVGLLARRKYGAPLILDLDDADLPNVPRGAWKLLKSLRDVRRHHWWWYTAMLRPFFGCVDARLAASHLLERLYGAAEYIPHARSATLFNPDKYPPASARRALHLEGLRTVMFLGTPRPHKGLAQLAEAVGSLPDDVRLVYVKGAHYPALFSKLDELAHGKTVQLAPFSFEHLPAVLASADVVALPQQRTLFASAQTPAKVFDAMAMGKPVVAAGVGDLAETLTGCGVVISEANPRLLASALAGVLEDPARAARLGQKARQRFLANYSLQTVRPRLVKLVRRLLDKNN